MILKINDRIRNRKVEFFDKFSLSLRYDSVASAFSFTGHFDADDLEQKEMYCVSHNHLVTLEHNNQLLLTGQILSERFKNSKVKSPVSISGYSSPGVLEDCQIPVSAYPLQSDGLTLREIAKRFLAPFKLGMVVDPAIASKMDEPIMKTTAQATQTVKDI